MKNLLDKIFQSYIVQLIMYIVLAVTFECGLHYLYNNILELHELRIGMILSYMIAPIIAVTYGAIAFRAIILALSWTIDSLIKIFKQGLKK